MTTKRFLIITLWGLLLAVLSACNLPVSDGSKVSNAPTPTWTPSNPYAGDMQPPSLVALPFEVQEVFYNGASCGDTKLVLRVMAQDDRKVYEVGVQYQFYPADAMPGHDWNIMLLLPEADSTYSATIYVDQEAERYLKDGHGVLALQYYVVDAAGNYQVAPENNVLRLNVKNCTLLASEQNDSAMASGSNSAVAASGHASGGTNTAGGSSGAAAGNSGGTSVAGGGSAGSSGSSSSGGGSAGSSGGGASNNSGSGSSSAGGSSSGGSSSQGGSNNSSSGGSGDTDATMVDCNLYPNDPLCQPVVQLDPATPTPEVYTLAETETPIPQVGGGDTVIIPPANPCDQNPDLCAQQP